jgi:hypothetical protein
MGKENGGGTINIGDNASIGMPEQESSPSVPFSTGNEMRRGKQPQIFNNNGGDSKADGGGTINKNGEYGSVTYGF